MDKVADALNQEKECPICFSKYSFMGLKDFEQHVNSCLSFSESKKIEKNKEI